LAKIRAAALEVKEDFCGEVFGAHSKVPNNEWITALSKDQKWLLQPEVLRAKLLAKANLE